MGHGHTEQVQQQLCKAGQLERFLDPSECTLAQRHFTGLYSLGSDMVQGSTSAFQFYRPFVTCITAL
jgi:hypothetical protein